MQDNNLEKHFYRASAADFTKIPGSPIAYWASRQTLKIFNDYIKLSEKIETREGMTTGCNDLFLRLWHEVDINNIAFNIKNNAEAGATNKRWFPCVKGGDFRRWSGNYEFVVDWFQDGTNLKNFKDPHTGRVRSHNYNGDYAFRPGFSWTSISSGTFAARHVPGGFMFDTKGPMGFNRKDNEEFNCIGLMNSKVVNHIIAMLSPTLDFKLGHILNIPFSEKIEFNHNIIIENAIEISLMDWDSFETSWGFHKPQILKQKKSSDTLEKSFDSVLLYYETTVQKLKSIEEKNNSILIRAYDLQEELFPEVLLHEVTLTCNPPYRYGPGKTNEEYAALQRADSTRELISFAIGCMMGRYSLDKQGLIYAHGGNKGFDPSLYATFPADEDGIIPVMDSEWLDDDATVRFVEFVRTVWLAESLDDNLKFVADSLDPKKGEAPVETIRRFISTKFFKDHHLKVYKKRPIYWLFSSGKHKAFECLVYLHRYNENTLPRMRASYVTPLQGRFNARIEYLRKELNAAPSTAARKQLQKELDTMTKKQQELRSFDELLRHYADQRITLDLDEGVKVNYGKFGGLLAEEKLVTGGGSND